MTISTSQLQELTSAVKKKFTNGLASHLRENYPDSNVVLSGTAVKLVDLREEQLHRLVHVALSRAYTHGLRSESCLAAFCAMMFDIAPNFDSHSLCREILSDKSIHPGKRLTKLLESLTASDWETLRTDYDTRAWGHKSAGHAH